MNLALNVSTVDVNALLKNFGCWISSDQISSPQAMNVIAVVETKLWRMVEGPLLNMFVIFPKSEYVPKDIW